MEPQNNTALVTCKPQFFKVLFPDPFANLMMPRKFHVNLPHKLQKMATLLSPSVKFWHVEIGRAGKDIYFQKGWSEFAKTYNLQIGYFVVFRYEGNMIFKVKVFDTTGCLKDYSPTSHVQLAAAYTENEYSSETGDQKPSDSSHESKSYIFKKRKLETGQALEIDKRDKSSISQKILPEKKDTETNLNSSICSRQFERILRPYCFTNKFLFLPKIFCVNNGLLTRRTIYLKISSSGETSWPVRFCLGAFRGQLGKGWKQFRDATGLKEGDRCIFRLVSKNSLVVTVIPQESNSTREVKEEVTEGSTSSVAALKEKQIPLIKQYSRPIVEYESNVRKYHLTHSYQTLGKRFCLDNMLTSSRYVTLRDLTGKEWQAKFYMHKIQGRLSRKGWTNFSREHGLKVGDKCIFNLIEKDTFLVRVVKS